MKSKHTREIVQLTKSNATKTTQTRQSKHQNILFIIKKNFKKEKRQTNLTAQLNKQSKTTYKTTSNKKTQKGGKKKYDTQKKNYK